MNTQITGWRRWIPTDKFVAAAVAGMAPILGSWIESGAFDKPEKSMIAVLLPSLVGAYFVSNKDRLQPTAPSA